MCHVDLHPFLQTNFNPEKCLWLHEMKQENIDINIFKLVVDIDQQFQWNRQKYLLTSLAAFWCEILIS